MPATGLFHKANVHEGNVRWRDRGNRAHVAWGLPLALSCALLPWSSCLVFPEFKLPIATGTMTYCASEIN